MKIPYKDGGTGVRCSVVTHEDDNLSSSELSKTRGIEEFDQRYFLFTGAAGFSLTEPLNHGLFYLIQLPSSRRTMLFLLVDERLDSLLHELSERDTPHDHARQASKEILIKRFEHLRVCVCVDYTICKAV